MTDIPPLDEGPLAGLHFKQRAEELEAENKRLNSALEFMGRKLDFMIPKVRVDEQIQLDKFEIGAVITWHLKMYDKCIKNDLLGRAAYHLMRSEALKKALPTDPLEGDNDVA